MERKPTDRQVEAYRYVYIFNCTQRETADFMEISQPAVSGLITRLNITYPDLIQKKSQNVVSVSYQEHYGNKIAKKF